MEGSDKEGQDNLQKPFRVCGEEKKVSTSIKVYTDLVNRVAMADFGSLIVMIIIMI